MIASTLLAATAFADGLPVEPGPFRNSDLIELKTLDPSLKLDIRYATKNNFLGRPVYPEARAFLQRPAAEALVRVNQALKRQGLGLSIFDGYRPWAVTKIFWDETPADKHEFVADPAKGSRHNRGCAVDLTLFDLKSGKPLPMPSDYDEMNEKSHPDYTGGSPETRANRDTLRKAMEAEGFSIYPNEWWHFDCKGWEHYGLMNLSFAQIDALQPGPEKQAKTGFTWPVPAGWKSETIPFPLEFAPELKHKGVEELRFMPGFLQPDGPNFWSYAFVWWLEDKPTFDGASLGAELENYFHGLCVAVGTEKKYPCTRSLFKAQLELEPVLSHPGHPLRLLGKTTTFDAFKTGKPITLILQIRPLDCPAQKRHAILLGASPKPAGDAVWKELNDVMDGFHCP